MKREQLIAEIADAIEGRLDSLAEADADLWECFIPPEAAIQMARVAVAIMEAYEAAEQFAEHEGRLTS